MWYLLMLRATSMLPKSLAFGAVFKASAQFDVVMGSLPCHSSVVSLTTRYLSNVSSTEELSEDLVCDSGYVVHASRFTVSAAVLAAIVVGVWFCPGKIPVARSGAFVALPSAFSALPGLCYECSLCSRLF